jgi:transcriptional regulator GlxA family with amidase domain
MNSSTSSLKIGMLLFEGFELLDVFGPLEMFSLLEGRPRLLMFAETPGAIASSAGPQCVAGSRLSDIDELDVLLVPGGAGTRREVGNSALSDALRRANGKTRFTASVCTGAALLARAGLLDGKRATTNKRAHEWVRSQGPAVNWVAEARWVADGKFFTSGGVSAGIDMSLALIARLRGRDTANAVAQRAEYEWHHDPSRDTFAKMNRIA